MWNPRAWEREELERTDSCKWVLRQVLACELRYGLAVQEQAGGGGLREAVETMTLV